MEASSDGGAIVPDVREESWYDDQDMVSAFLQEWEIEELFAAGQPAAWPECPLHPDSYPLSATAIGALG